MDTWTSQRPTPHVEQLYAIIVPGEEGPYLEGVARHMLHVEEEAIVALPLITDDVGLVERMLAVARKHHPGAYVVAFSRR